MNRATLIRRIQKLNTLADRHPDTHEGRSARAKAIELSKKLPKARLSPEIKDMFGPGWSTEPLKED